MDATYISCAATAKLIRKALAAAYPGIKFSVTSKCYSMGASIDVRYIDGPATKDVEAIVKEFEGATFDGMNDLKSNLTRFVNGRPIDYGADYVFVWHSWSDALKAQIHAAMYADWGREIGIYDNDYTRIFNETATEIARRQYPARVDTEEMAR